MCTSPNVVCIDDFEPKDCMVTSSKIDIVHVYS